MAGKYRLGDFLKDINYEKNNILRNDPEAHKDYDPFIINMMLSYHPDCIAIVNELNRRPDMPKQMQYDFLIKLIRPRKRFARMDKAIKSEHIEMLMEYYNYSEKRAHESLYYLTDEFMEGIKQKLDKGGFS